MRYYFDMHNGIGFIPDEEGQIAPDDAAARRIAIENIRSIVGEEAGKGTLDLRGRIDVRREAGENVNSVAFIDAFELLLPPEGP